MSTHTPGPDKDGRYYAKLLPCGCGISFWEDASGVKIEFCSTHAAAPELLEALKLYVAIDSLRHAGGHIAASQWAEANQAAHAAMQEAGGSQ
jgi:hypothetical protein